MHAAKKLKSILASVPAISIEQCFYRSVKNASLHNYNPPKPLYALGPGNEGARYTPVGGPPCLYVSAKPLTTLCEVAGIASSLLEAGAVLPYPLTLYSVKVKLKYVLDLADPEVCKALGTTLQELDGSWEQQLKNSVPVPTHILASAAHASGRFQGIKFVSHEDPTTINLMIWTETIRYPCYVEVQDSTGQMADRIPKSRKTSGKRPP
jgi:RES domain-containing protein